MEVHMSQQNNPTSTFKESNSRIQSYQQQLTQNRTLEKDKERQFTIPNINKKMNPIEKYLSQFVIKGEQSKRTIQHQTPHLVTSRDKSIEKELSNHFRSVDINDFNSSESFNRTSNKTCVTYESIVNRNSIQRLEKLGKLEKDYQMLKQKVSPKKKYHNSITGSDFSTIRNFQITNNRDIHISDDDIDKEIKHTHVNQNGRKYYADLYLLKKGRQNIMSSLSNAGKISLIHNNDSVSVDQLFGKLSYEQKIRAKEKQFVNDKIVSQRQRKRNKMIRGRHLNWNVYYDILALSSSEKSKLKGMCKFPTKFGIV